MASVYTNLYFNQPIVVLDTTAATQSSGSLVLYGGFSALGNTNFSGLTNISNSTQSSAYNNGALVVSGGVGIGKNLNVSGNTLISGSLTAGSFYAQFVGTESITTTTLLSTNISSAYLSIGLSTISNLLSSSISAGTLYLSTGITTATLHSTIGSFGTVSTSLLSAQTMTGANMYLSGDLFIAGTLTAVNITTTNLVDTNMTAGIARITSHLAATGNSNTIGNVFTTGGNVGINTTDPNYQVDVNGSMRVVTDLYVNGSISGTNSTFATLTLTSTNPSISTSDGSLLTYGGITIGCTVDAISVTNGGSLLTNGGAAVGKMLFVGDSVNVINNIQSNTLAILSTENGLGIGTGGSLTVFGGSSISKDLYVGGTVTSSSDIRLKTNISNFKNTNESILNKIDNLRTIKYTYKDDESNTPHVGFIAQDFVSDFPEFTRCPKDGFYSLDYQKISVILLECVKELKTQVHLLKQEIQSKNK